MNTRFPKGMATVKKWDSVAGWDIEVHAKAWAVWNIADREVAWVVVKGSTAADKRAGSGMEQAKL